MTTADHLELIVWSGLIAAASVTTIATIVGTLTYLLTRERSHPAPARPTAVPKVPAVRHRAAAEPPVAVAG
ncbi:MAG: hypothetical protein K2X87_03650 [Gemmataceae bacterium]|nr:hypothetical protein [Gemmataceae bacterium]